MEYRPRVSHTSEESHLVICKHRRDVGIDISFHEEGNSPAPSKFDPSTVASKKLAPTRFASLKSVSLTMLCWNATPRRFLPLKSELSRLTPRVIAIVLWRERASEGLRPGGKARNERERACETRARCDAKMARESRRVVQRLGAAAMEEKVKKGKRTPQRTDDSSRRRRRRRRRRRTKTNEVTHSTALERGRSSRGYLAIRGDRRSGIVGGIRK